jgi:hypothetical protein
MNIRGLYKYQGVTSVLYKLRGFNFCEKQENRKHNFSFLLIRTYYDTSSIDAVTARV